MAAAVGAAVWVAVAGWHFRRWTWETTSPIRYTPDVERGYQWGRIALADGRDAAGRWHLYGLLNQYEKMEPEQPQWLNWLDSAPLRLAVMTAWAAHAESQFPRVMRWADDRSYTLTRPMLLINTTMEALAAFAAFGLVRAWVRRCEDEPRPAVRMPWWRGSELGLLAATIFWLNPAVVLDAYGWPSWDVWIIPFFLLAAWAAVCDLWLWAGIGIGIGAMFKGQELAMVPVFVIWAFVAGRPRGALRFLIGSAAAIAIVTLPWLLSYIPQTALAVARTTQMNRVHHPWDVQPGLFNIPRAIDWPAICWIGCVALVITAVLQLRGMSVLLMSFTHLLKKKNMSKMLMPRLGIEVAIGCVALALLIWPWLMTANLSTLWIGFAAAILMLACMCFIRCRSWLLTAVTALALLASPALFHGSYAWWTVGVSFGTRHWPRLFMGNTDNLPALLAYHFGWATDNLDAVVFTLPAKWLHVTPARPFDVSISQLLTIICGTLIAVASVGVGLHFRRRDRRFLVALVTPWLLLYLVPAQVQAQCLLFAAGAACVCIGDGLGTAALGLVLSVAAGMTTLQSLFDGPDGVKGSAAFGRTLARQFPALFDADAGGKIRRFLAGAHPDFGWALLLCGAVFLYLSIAPSRSNKAAGGIDGSGEDRS